MEKRAGRIVLVLCVTLATGNYASSAEVSSMIDFRSQEDDRGSNDSDPKPVVGLNEVNEEDNDFRKPDESRKPKYDFIRDDSTKRPDVLDNIQIVVNGKAVGSNVDECRSGVCKVSVSSNRDKDGNIVTDVHLRIITKVEPDPKINDIPVIDGIHGVHSPHFHSGFRPSNSFHSPTHGYDNVPQIQTRYHGGEPWYQGPRNFQRPQIVWRSHHPGESASRRFPSYGGRSFGKPVVDDKIEPPLSKTQGSDE
ncbi:uncharacterized protein LOC128876591 [Hylaeus volcanicus]|uniref:uncharacterized protein LOC128876591 n=1 Tax=Hylaeus volcanicus TaxID=313075 RepID=UPI0023B83153|nr:uncharacterized protein LOC128876591 [Hylaeus volcanicus]